MTEQNDVYPDVIRLRLQEDLDDGGWVASSDRFPGRAGQGETRAAAVSDWFKAVDASIEIERILFDRVAEVHGVHGVDPGRVRDSLPPGDTSDSLGRQEEAGVVDAPTDWQAEATLWMKRATYFQARLLDHGEVVGAEDADRYFAESRRRLGASEFSAGGAPKGDGHGAGLTSPATDPVATPPADPVVEDDIVVEEIPNPMDHPNFRR